MFAIVAWWIVPSTITTLGTLVVGLATLCFARLANLGTFASTTTSVDVIVGHAGDGGYVGR